MDSGLPHPGRVLCDRVGRWQPQVVRWCRKGRANPLVSRRMILRCTARVIIPPMFLFACISSAQTRERQLSVLCSLSIKPATIRPQSKNELEISLSNPLKKDLTVTALEVYLSPNMLVEAPDRTFYAPVDLEAGRPLYADQGLSGPWPYPALAVKIAGGQEKKFSVDLSSLLWSIATDEMPLSSSRLDSLEGSGPYLIFARVTVKGYKHQMTSNRVQVTWLDGTQRGLQLQ